MARGVNEGDGAMNKIGGWGCGGEKGEGEAVRGEDGESLEDVGV